MARTPKEFSYTLSANESLTVNRAGSYVRCIDSGEAFFVRGLDNQGQAGNRVEISEGIGLPLNSFDKLEITNGPNAQTIKIYISDQNVDDSRQYGEIDAKIASVANLSDGADVTISSGANGLIVASNADRQTLHIVNTSTTRTLRIGTSSTAAARGLPVGPGLSFTMNNFDGALYGYAIGGNIDVAYLEVTK